MRDGKTEVEKARIGADRLSKGPYTVECSDGLCTQQYDILKAVGKPTVWRWTFLMQEIFAFVEWSI